MSDLIRSASAEVARERRSSASIGSKSNLHRRGERKNRLRPVFAVLF
jgi:hypothetical protein